MCAGSLPPSSPEFKGSLCVLVLVALLAGCRSEPASLTLEPLPGPLLTYDPVPLPRAVVKDAKDRPLEPQPEVTFSVEPESLLLVNNGQLYPQVSGAGLLTATVKDSPVSASMAVQVSLVDRVSLECLGNKSCAYLEGEAIELKAALISGDRPLEGVELEAKWTSADSAVARVLGAGKLHALSPGQTEVKVELAGRLKGTQLIRVVKPARLHIDCGEEEYCSVIQSEQKRLTAKVLAEGDIHLPQVPVTWSSSAPEVLAVRGLDGTIEGLREGSAFLTASAGGVESQLRVVVKLPPPRVIMAASSPSGDKGSGAPGEAYNYYITVGNKRVASVDITCNTAMSIVDRCINRQLGLGRRTAADKPVTNQELLAAAVGCGCRSL